MTTHNAAKSIGMIQRIRHFYTLRNLQHKLTYGEIVKHIITGTHDGKHGLLVATDSRVMFAAKDTMHEIPINRLIAMRTRFSNPPMMGVIARDKSIIVENVKYRKMLPFVEYVRDSL